MSHDFMTDPVQRVPKLPSASCPEFGFPFLSIPTNQQQGLEMMETQRMTIGIPMYSVCATLLPAAMQNKRTVTSGH